MTHDSQRFIEGSALDSGRRARIPMITTTPQHAGFAELKAHANRSEALAIADSAFELQRRQVIHLWTRRIKITSIARRLRMSVLEVVDILQSRPRVPAPDAPRPKITTCPWCHADIAGTTAIAPHVCK